MQTLKNNWAVAAHGLEKIVPVAEGNLTIVAGVSLEINSGQSVAITGVSGSGKTTLLSLLAGLDTPTAGKVTLAGQTISAMNEDERAQVRLQHVGFVFQAFHLLPHLNALENVMLPLELAGKPHPRKRSLDMLKRVGLKERSTHFPTHLSGGEQQRVALARAFAVEPSILFADEPTGNLDGGNSEAVAQLLFSLNQEHDTTLVLVTHDMELAHRCEKTYTMSNGLLESKAALL
ncbi:ABC transporter ATP-binding protein [Desulfurispira natronophila]|uniref:Putative ABC transport system ATP-binding protein n=1 Tax=Desulfurispira natronophila TaxID=682562 RepID=A0A7W7Y2G6_9BACT|nr:ABC transporter ATP-binding protein [Desulfurispira natronophila]MBB5020875.1 putative ABC transport system ATP-binding protein [Desulfurispira natronophila]